MDELYSAYETSQTKKPNEAEKDEELDEEALKEEKGEIFD